MKYIKKNINTHKKSLIFLISMLVTISLSSCSSENTYISSLKMEISELSEDLEAEKENNKKLQDINNVLKKENEALKEERNDIKEKQQNDTINYNMKDFAKRIFYNENGYLDVDEIGEAFQFKGVEGYQVIPEGPGTLAHLSPINPHYMGEYFGELNKDGVGYLVNASDYTDIKISGDGLASINEHSEVAYCPYYDPKNNGKDSTEGYPGYILCVSNTPSVEDKTKTIYDFDTFEVLISDCTLRDNSLAWHMTDREIYIEPYLKENGYEGEYNCTIIKKDGINYLVDYSSFKPLAEDVKDIECKIDDAGVRIVTITHSDGSETIYLNEALQPIQTDILTKKLKK